MIVKVSLAAAAGLAGFLVLSCASCSSSSKDAGATPADASSTSRPPTDTGGGDAGTSSVEVELYGFTDLPRKATTQSLSGTAFDEASRTLWAIQDKTTDIVSFQANEDYTSWTETGKTVFQGMPAGPWDGEGLVRIGTDFIAVTDETTPSVARFDATGHFLASLEMPAHFATQSAGNKGLESLTLSPSGRYLFTANESALATDGPGATKTAGTTVRILRRELASNHDEEHAYRTEPLGAGTGGDMGVSDMLALSDDDLLVLERGYQSGYGNTVRIFRVSLAGAPDVLDVKNLSASTPVLAKTLLVDLSTLPPSDAPNPQTQPNPLLDNYEALALGPKLPDGRRLVFVTSDDNASKAQVPRILALAVRGF
ncbi:hypothetical protein AKJ09_07371 [Labilithrix luteola]|uniref:Phytase-like domain-containing protein n=1 Tax=Labilithrix luteola TaxID=1391654 RepID=A0A0K1Q4R6_9BACT|nr:esterase-like activity of phytase family protein [Labilithrix luteola]AKV00708.1 hypothetical protein AKJ09_07371 [Labilithrix luteola]